MKTGDHVWYRTGTAVHLLLVDTANGLSTPCNLWCTSIEQRVLDIFHPTSAPVTCLKCLAKEEG